MYKICYKSLEAIAESDLKSLLLPVRLCHNCQPTPIPSPSILLSQESAGAMGGVFFYVLNLKEDPVIWAR